jgi:hypothetical protein
MATSFRSGDASTGARTAEPSEPVPSMPSETSPGKVLKDVPTHQYIGIQDLRQRIEAQATELEACRTNQQYIAFRDVTDRDLEQIDRERESFGTGTRFCYYNKSKDLVIKMVTARHEGAHNTLADELRDALRDMGLPKRDIVPVGAARFPGFRRKMEGDSSFKPRTRDQRDDWPSIVFECGLSESLANLRDDARWWLTDSQGAVKIVVIVLVSEKTMKLQVEKWVTATATATSRPATRAHPNPNSSQVPMAETVITITRNTSAPTTGAPQPAPPPQYTVTGAPLLLEFEKILLRPPVAPESDVIFTKADLESWAADFWDSFK